MKDLKKFHKSLMKESNVKEYNIDEALSKDLAREDALGLIGEFVKDVKKKFDPKDAQEILKDASKTLDFYINEIENTSSIDIMSAPAPGPALSFDDIISTKSDSDSDSLSNKYEGDE